MAFKAVKQPPLAGSSTRARARAPQRKGAEPGSPHAVKSAAAAWELRIFCLLQHVNALRGGEEPGKTPRRLRNPARMGHFLPLVIQPKQTHQGAHVHDPIQHGHRNALAGTQAAYLGRTKSTKEILQASPQRERFAAQVRADKRRHARQRPHLPSTCSTK